MTNRFYLPADLTASELTLGDSEAHHLARVLRLSPGDRVRLFDGRGAEVEATIDAIAKRHVRLRPGSVRRPPPPVPVPITLAVAPPKGDRFRWLVEKATELGVNRVIPLLTERGIVEPRAAKLDKLRSTIIAASKQSHRCQLMELTEPVPLSRLSQSAPPSPHIVLHTDHPPLARFLAEPRQSLTLMIGPEGGFTSAEIEQATQFGAHFASLGATILRTETAAVAAAALAAHSARAS